MQAVVYSGYRELEVVQRDPSAVSEGFALIQVSHCGVSTRDVESFVGENPHIKSHVVLGQEICGTISHLGSGLNAGLVVGTKVVVNPLVSCGKCFQCKQDHSNHCQSLRFIGSDLDGGFAEFVKAPLENLLPVSADVNLEQFVLTFPIGEAHHMISHIDFKDVDDVLIIGAGPVGVLSGLILSKKQGLRIDILDTNSFRLNIARGLGLFGIDGRENQIEETIRQRTPGKGGPDVILNISGDPESLQLAMQLVRAKGQIIVSGRIQKVPSLDFVTVVEKEISLKGSFMYVPEDLSEGISEVSKQEMDLRPLITHRLPLEGVSEAIRIIENVNETMKIVISMRNGE